MKQAEHALTEVQLRLVSYSCSDEARRNPNDGVDDKGETSNYRLCAKGLSGTV